MSSMEQSLQNEYVLEHIFGFLNLEEVKKCRFVNRRWKNVGNILLRQKTKVQFDFQDLSTGLFKLQKIIKANDSYVTDEGLLNNTPFASFHLSGKFDSRFLDFLKMGKCIKELDINCSSCFLMPTKCFDLNILLGDHLEKFHFKFVRHGKAWDKANFYMTLDPLPFVQDLELNGVEIDVSTSVRQLCPKIINLGSDITYTKNGIRVEEFVINEIFNLENTKSISIIGRNMTLDFAQCTNSKVKKDYLFLQDVTVLNWDTCDWKVSELHLVEVPFIERNLLEIDSFIISRATVDFSVIHEPLKIRKVHCLKKTAVVDKTFFFPNVGDIHLIDKSISILRNFSANENVNKVQLNRSLYNIQDYQNSVEVRIEHFPKYVNHLILQNIRIEGNGVCETETLRINDHFHSSLDESRRLYKYFTGEYFFIDINTLNLNYDPYQFVVSPKPFKYYSIAGLKWTTNGFANTQFSKCVDSMAQSYMFKGKRGVYASYFELQRDSFYNSTYYFGMIGKLVHHEHEDLRETLKT